MAPKVPNNATIILKRSAILMRFMSRRCEYSSRVLSFNIGRKLTEHSTTLVFFYVFMYSRRKFLTDAGTVAAGAFGATSLSAQETSRSSCTETVGLCGLWSFRTDPGGIGSAERWYEDRSSTDNWQSVNVPHTWQIDPTYADYRGIAWYERKFDVPGIWQHSAVRIEFEAVFHTATIWVNGRQAGEHARKGYTAFTLEITPFLRWGEPNVITVRVDNAFNEHMLPRGRSSDWAHDGGIYRPVQLLITPKTFVERVDVDAVPGLSGREGKMTISAYVKNADSKRWYGRALFQVVDGESGQVVLTNAGNPSLMIEAGASQTMFFHAVLPHAKLWHFDHPHLYQLEVSIADDSESHQFNTTFGIRKLEVKDGKFHLNGEPVQLMGVERMAGSNPEYGMAEPEDWIKHDLADLKHLNCIFTRVHWPQDKRVLDYCDRHGILMQIEVPAWGPDTFRGMGAIADADIMQNGLEQLQEMIARDRNHPSVVVWGLCNEIDGQNPPAYQFTKHMYEEAKRLDPGRLCTYASNSLFKNAERDAAALMDFIETNEYFGTWEPGTAEDAAKHLDDLHRVFPEKPIVISEYGYCACTKNRPEGDEQRVGIVRTHTVAIRSKDYIGGAIFFCYNDYRTHVGDRGAGPLKQRVHGVVDVYGRPKPSYEVLRAESSLIQSMSVKKHGSVFRVLLQTRRRTPMYILHGYRLRGVLYGKGDIPVEQQETELAATAPGAEAQVELKFTETETPLRVRFDVLRPNRFSVYSFNWTP
jgi:beta-galactosidase